MMGANMSVLTLNKIEWSQCNDGVFGVETSTLLVTWKMVVVIEMVKLYVKQVPYGGVSHSKEEEEKATTKTTKTATLTS